MAETVRFLDAVSYDADDVAYVVNALYGTSFVIPTPKVELWAGYWDGRLNCSTAGGSAQVFVWSGCAVVKGTFYELTPSAVITLDAQGGGVNRIDRIVLRRDSAAQTVRLTVIKGTAAANPTIPALTGEDMALWYIYVPDGFGAASVVSQTDIHDERVFGSLAEIHGTASMYNLLPNANLMAWSSVTDVPERWRRSATINSIAPAAINGSMNPRGQAMDVTLDPGEWIEIVTFPPYGETDGGDYSVTLQGSLYLTSGVVDVSLEYSAGTVLSANSFRVAGALRDILIRAEIDSAAKKAMTSINVRIENTGAGATVFTLNPLSLVKGFIPGARRQKHEIIMTDDMYDAAWTATAKATGAYQIDLAANFAARVLRSTRAIIGRMKANDSGSAAAAVPCGMESFSYYPTVTGSGGKLELAKHVNSKNQETQHITGVSISSHSVGVEVWAATVFTATYSITGVVV